MPQMGHATKIDRLTDCQSQCDFDLRLVLRSTQPPIQWGLREGVFTRGYSAEREADHLSPHNA
jgi:hypothetical protein